MKKKTAIITFHCVPNYGAVLQAYALQTKLKEVSSEVGIVDYRPSRLTAEYKDISFYSIFSVSGSLWSLNSFRKKKKKFAQFENEYLDLIPCDERNGTVILKDATPDIVFLGSDQIWNPDITHGFDRIFRRYHCKCALSGSFICSQYRQEEFYSRRKKRFCRADPKSRRRLCSRKRNAGYDENKNLEKRSRSLLILPFLLEKCALNLWQSLFRTKSISYFTLLPG